MASRVLQRRADRVDARVEFVDAVSDDQTELDALVRSLDEPSRSCLLRAAERDLADPEACARASRVINAIAKVDDLHSLRLFFGTMR